MDSLDPPSPPDHHAGGENLTLLFGIKKKGLVYATQRDGPQNQVIWTEVLVSGMCPEIKKLMPTIQL